MSIKVGEGHIDIEARLDEQNFVKTSREMAQRATLVWGKEWTDKMKRLTSDFTEHYEVSMNKAMAASSKLDKQRQAALADIQKQQAEAGKKALKDLNDQMEAAKKLEAQRLKTIEDARKAEADASAQRFRDMQAEWDARDKLDAQRQKAYADSAKAQQERFDNIRAEMNASNQLEAQKNRAIEERRRQNSAELNEAIRNANILRSQEESDRAAGEQASNAYITEQNKRMQEMFKAHTKGVEQLEKANRVSVTRGFGDGLNDVDKDVDRHGGFWQHTLGRHLLGAFDGVMSLMPSRLEFLFTKTGPLIGGTLAAALILAMTIFIPALGAMIAGLFFGGFGLAAAIAAVFVGIADDKRVANAAARIAKTFKERIIYDPSMQNIGQVLTDQLDKVNEALNRWAPSINSILQAGAKFLGPLTDGLIAMMDVLLPAMDRLANSQFVSDLIQIISAGFVQIGAAFQGSFDKFLNDPQAMEGAKMGLRDFFDFIASGISLIFDFIRWLSRMWFLLNNDPEGEGSSPLDKLRAAWKFIKDILDVIFSITGFIRDGIIAVVVVAWQLWERFDQTYHVVDKVRAVLSTIKEFVTGASHETVNFLKNSQGVKDAFEEIKRLSGIAFDGIKGGAKEAFSFFKDGFGPGFGDSLKDFGGKAAENAKELWEKLGGAWDKIREIWNTQIWPIVQEMIPKMLPIFKALGEMWRSILEAFLAVAGFVLSVLGPAFQFLWGVLQTLWQIFGPAVLSVIKDVWQGIIDIIMRVVHIFTDVFDIIKHLFKGEWASLWDAVLRLLANVWGLVIDILRNAWNIIWGLLKGLFQGLMTILGPFGSWVAKIWSGIFESIWGWLQRVWDVILQFFVMLWHYWVETWHNIYNFVIGIWNLIVNFIRTGIAIVVNIWQTAWTAVRDFFVGVWNAIWGFIGPGMNLIGELIRAGFQVIIAIFLIVSKVLYIIWEAVWSFIYRFIVENWRQIIAFLAPVVAVLVAIVVGAVTWIRDHWYAIWTAVRDFFVMIWNAVWNFLAPIISRIVDFIVMAVNFIRTTWEVVWNLVWGFIQFIWNSMWTFLSAIITRVQTFIHNFLLGVQVIWELIWGVIWGYISMIWDRIFTGTSDTLGRLRDIISTVMEVIRVAWNTVWQGIHDVLGGIWQGIVNSVSTGLQFVIDVLNRGIRAINGILEALGIDFRIGEIPPLGGAPQVPQQNPNQREGRVPLAGGGRVYGPGTTTSDSVPIAASRDEFMMKAKAARKIGYNRLAYMNATGNIPGFAGGGRVGGNNNGLLEQHRNHVHVAMNVPPMGYPAIIAAAAASGLPFNVSSTYRPGSRGSGGGLDHHSEGRAVDFGGYEQDALAGYFERLSGVIELIHRTSARDYAIFGGSGGGGGFLKEFVARGLGWVMGKINPIIDGLAAEMPRTVPGQIGRGVIIGLRDGLQAKIKALIEKETAAADAGNWAGSAGGGAQQWSGTALAALQRLGLPESWLRGLLAKMQQESGGNPRAINLTDSNAQRGTPSKGLMQVIDPTFGQYRDTSLSSDIYDPLANITAALRYIVAKYGGVPNLPAGGYDQGGYLPPGIWNGTNTPEPVFTGTQWDILKGNMGGGFNGDVHVYVDGVEVASRTVVEENNLSLAQDLYRG